jgi:hypothetical protein
MTIDPERLRELCAKGLNASQIASRLGVTVSAIHQATKRLSLDVAAAGKIGSRGFSLGKSA